ncbi:MAG: P1 family peptidase [Gammaproteobacteria bacterium]
MDVIDTATHHTLRPGPRNAITDVAGVAVGQAADADIGTGVTVVVPAQGCVGASDVRGGAPGTFLTDILDSANVGLPVDAVVLTGGSVFGMGAAQAVIHALAASGRGADFVGRTVPCVPAAVIFDLHAHRRDDWLEASPYPALGRAALAAACVEVAQGSVGAGTGASACSYAGGVGTASAVTLDGLVVGAVVVVNSFGEVVIPGTKHFWAWPFEFGDEFGGLGGPAGRAPLSPELSVPPALRQPGMSTTLAVVATNASLDRPAAKRMAIMAQDGIARAVRPVHTLYDGDVVFTLATGERATPADPLEQARIGHLAADCVARAIARAVYHAGPRAQPPSWRETWG